MWQVLTESQATETYCFVKRCELLKSTALQTVVIVNIVDVWRGFLSQRLTGYFVCYIETPTSSPQQLVLESLLLFCWCIDRYVLKPDFSISNDRKNPAVWLLWWVMAYMGPMARDSLWGGGYLTDFFYDVNIYCFQPIGGASVTSVFLFLLHSLDFFPHRTVVYR